MQGGVVVGGGVGGRGGGRGTGGERFATGCVCGVEMRSSSGSASSSSSSSSDSDWLARSSGSGSSRPNWWMILRHLANIYTSSSDTVILYTQTLV